MTDAGQRQDMSPARDSDATVPARWTTLWSRPVGWTLNHVLYRTSVTGRSNVPATGPVIFAGNHISFLDGPVMFGASPRAMHILVKKEMFTGFLGRVLQASGQLAVDRTGDRAALPDGQECAGRRTVRRHPSRRDAGERRSLRHQQGRRLARAELRCQPWSPWPSLVPGPAENTSTPFRGCAGVCTSASAEPSTSAAGPARPGVFQWTGPEPDPRRAGPPCPGLDPKTGQPLPDADSPQERHEAAAGTPADHP